MEAIIGLLSLASMYAAVTHYIYKPSSTRMSKVHAIYIEAQQGVIPEHLRPNGGLERLAALTHRLRNVGG